MEVMDDEDRMQQIGVVAGRVLLAVALVTARNKGDGLETRRVAGAAIGGADTQGETNCRVRNALDVEGTPDRSGEPPATGTRPTRGLRI